MDTCIGKERGYTYGDKGKGKGVRNRRNVFRMVSYGLVPALSPGKYGVSEMSLLLRPMVSLIYQCDTIDTIRNQES